MPSSVEAVLSEADSVDSALELEAVDSLAEASALEEDAASVAAELLSVEEDSSAVSYLLMSRLYGTFSGISLI